MNETEYTKAKEDIMNLLHDFHKECLESPWENMPLSRRRRKQDYADKIIDRVLLAESND